MQNSPRTGRSIIAFLVKAVWLHETTPPSHSTRHWQCWCTVQSALPRRAPDLSNAGLSLHILHSLLEDSDEGARWDLPHLHTALVGVALNAKGEGGVLEPCTVVEGTGRIGQSNEQKEKVWLK